MMNFAKTLNNHLPFSQEVIDTMLNKWAEDKFNFAPTTAFNEEYQIVKPISIVIQDHKDNAISIFKNIISWERARQIDVDSYTLTVVNDDAGVISSGMKISRVLSRGLVDDSIQERLDARSYDRRSLKQVKEDAINQMSREVQKADMKGNLYLSANPLDYITMSENAAGWSSCHGLDGGFASGTVSYMQDATTFIAGLSSAKKHEFEDSNGYKIEWYSKQWRAVVYMNANGYAIGRQYPFRSEELVDSLSEMIEGTFFAGKEFNGGMSIYNQGPVYVDSVELSKRVVGAPNRDLNVGAESYCRDCNEWYHEGDVDCSAFQCADCSGVGSIYCECCDDRMSEYDACWIDGTEESVCEHCRDNHYSWCDKCESYHRDDDMVNVEGEAICCHCAEDYSTVCDGCNDTFLRDNCEYHDETDQMLCKDCLDAEIEAGEEIEEGKSYELRNLSNTLNGFSVGEVVVVRALPNDSTPYYVVENLVGIIGYAKRAGLKVLN